MLRGIEVTAKPADHLIEGDGELNIGSFIWKHYLRRDIHQAVCLTT